MATHTTTVAADEIGSGILTTTDGDTDIIQFAARSTAASGDLATSDGRDFNAVEVLSIDGAGILRVTVNGTDPSSSDKKVWFVPAASGASVVIQLPAEAAGVDDPTPTVKVTGSAATQYVVSEATL